ncbi:MAG TPA: hypothetical protein ENK44_00900 [Caldithrix abyssi]|uniref:Four helix bundle protein n=1 Tax=Caldithrix abyssi TaxID=187145 RepID=A0A7V4TZT0_CALAY|nr:hypothetical protein [Caldithrix abyssi]
MRNDETTKPVYDLEERTFNFARDVRVFIKTLPNSLANLEDCKQLVRASGSIGANYFTIWNLFVPPGRVVICFLEFYYQVLQEKN